MGIADLAKNDCLSRLEQRCRRLERALADICGRYSYQHLDDGAREDTSAAVNEGWRLLGRAEQQRQILRFGWRVLEGSKGMMGKTEGDGR